MLLKVKQRLTNWMVLALQQTNEKRGDMKNQTKNKYYTLEKKTKNEKKSYYNNEGRKCSYRRYCID